MDDEFAQMAEEDARDMPKHRYYQTGYRDGFRDGAEALAADIKEHIRLVTKKAGYPQGTVLVDIIDANLAILLKKGTDAN